MNLNKDMDKRSFVQFSALHHPPTSASTSGSGSGSTPSHRLALSANSKTAEGSEEGGEKEVVAFTCGHAFGRNYFLSVLLPEFVTRLGALQPPIPITAKFLQAEYQQAFAVSPASTAPTSSSSSSSSSAAAAAPGSGAAPPAPFMAVSCPLCLYHALTQQQMKSGAGSAQLRDKNSGGSGSSVQSAAPTSLLRQANANAQVRASKAGTAAWR